MARQRRTRAIWERHVAAFEAGGQTRDAYCSAHGLSRSTLDYWRRRLRSERSPGKCPARNASPATFVPVRVAPMGGADRVAAVLHCSGGIRMAVARDADPVWLAQVLSGLR